MENKNGCLFNVIKQFIIEYETKEIIKNIRFPEKREFSIGDLFSIDCNIYNQNELILTARCNSKKGFCEFKKTYSV